MGRAKGFERDTVLDLAIQLFWKKGYADTSLSDLEKATGVNKSGLYSEFKDKDDIFYQSLVRYTGVSVKYEILRRDPLGWNNIKDFLEEGFSCKGQKGCFAANSMREYAILPQNIRRVLEENGKYFSELMLNNIKATQTKKDPEMLANLISTFASGLCLKLNTGNSKNLILEVESFLNLLK